MVGGRTPGVGARAGVLSGPGRGHSQPQLFVFARAGLLGPAEQKKERGGGWGGDRERQERGAILTVLMPFSPRRAPPPGAHSFARRARPALQPRRVAGPLRPGKGAQRMRSGAGGRPGEADARGGMATGQSQSRLQLLRDRAHGACPRAARVCPAYLHPLPDRAALSHRLEMRDPGRSPRRGAAVLGLRSGQGLRCVRRVLGKGQLGARRVWSLHRDPPQPRMPSRQRARPEEGLEAGALDIRRERRGRDAASQPVKGDCGYNHLTSSVVLGLPAFTTLPSTPPHCPLDNSRVSSSPFHQEEGRRPERLEDSPEATRLISGRAQSRNHLSV